MTVFLSSQNLLLGGGSCFFFFLTALHTKTRGGGNNGLSARNCGNLFRCFFLDESSNDYNIIHIIQDNNILGKRNIAHMNIITNFFKG